jgi:hypothetical protein
MCPDFGRHDLLVLPNHTSIAVVWIVTLMVRTQPDNSEEFIASIFSDET